MITDDMMTEARARDVCRLFEHRRYGLTAPGTKIKLENVERRFRFHAAKPERAVARIWIRHAPGLQYHYADSGDIPAQAPFCTRKHLSVMAISDPEYFAAQVWRMDVDGADVVAGRAHAGTGPLRGFVIKLLHGSPSAEDIDAERERGRREVKDGAAMKAFRTLSQMLPWVRQAALDIAALDAAFAASVRTRPIDVPLSEEDQEDLDAISGGDW